MSGRKSDVWNFFTVSKTLESKAICNICKCLVSRGGVTSRSFSTTNLKRHLENSHPLKWKTFKLQFPKPAQQPLQQPITSHVVGVASTSQLSPCEDVDEPMCSPNEVKRPAPARTFHDVYELMEKNKPYPPSHARSVKINNLIAQMICKDLLPFSIVENEGKFV